jgi:hypothetical protein
MFAKGLAFDLVSGAIVGHTKYDKLYIQILRGRNLVFGRAEARVKST